MSYGEIMFFKPVNGKSQKKNFNKKGKKWKTEDNKLNAMVCWELSQ
jgi:hypothetical protein